MNTRTRVAYAALAGLAWAPGTFADWTAHADFSACPRKYYPNLSWKEAPVATEAECKAQIDRAKRGDSAVCVRYACVEGAGGGAAASAAPGHELDKTIEDAISAGLSGQISGTDAAALVGVGVIANAFFAGISPEEQQRRQQQAEAARRQAAEQARLQAVAEEQRKDRLLGEMQGVEQTDYLQLMTDDSDPSVQAGGDAGAAGELAFMTDDDDTRGIMGKRKAPTPKRNQPPATRVSTGPYTPGAVRKAGAETVATKADPPPPPNPGPAAEPESRARGGVDGEACNQRSPGALCGNLRGEALDRCQRNYNEGYDEGAERMQRTLTARGAAEGARDRGRIPNRALSFPGARGPCGNIFVQAYNNAFRP